MFKTLGLFATSQCPDTSCNRPRCFFAHGENIRTSSAPGVVSGPSKARAKGGNSKNSVGGGSKDGAVLNAARGVSDVPLIPRSEAAQSLVNKVTTPLPKTGRSPAKPAVSAVCQIGKKLISSSLDPQTQSLQEAPSHSRYRQTSRIHRNHGPTVKKAVSLCLFPITVLAQISQSRLFSPNTPSLFVLTSISCDDFTDKVLSTPLSPRNLFSLLEGPLWSKKTRHQPLRLISRLTSRPFTTQPFLSPVVRIQIASPILRLARSVKVESLSRKQRSDERVV